MRAEIADYAQTSTSLGLNLLRFVIGAVLLWFGSTLIVGGAGVKLFGMDLSGAGAAVIGKGMGLSPLLTGLLPVAIGTALPEIAAAIAAARRGQGDMVVGHVIGAEPVQSPGGRRRHGCGRIARNADDDDEPAATDRHVRPAAGLRTAGRAGASR